ncbi:4Fe-4S dicluster domain-containing protein [Paraburkholderia sp. A1RI_3L]|uniref:4Fe-4S dicluster domain-containing protein n=1 Tax=Paraburkholderia TaxID=1822464 RepID=UPI0018F43FFF|nr:MULTISPECIES: 4Fe-4S dicluster domain-containing protein [Paraburkholderia]WEY37612.1 4Fe-4S dicluster domain-containing protein [Paraburkholderia sp. SUR17]
MRETSTSGCKQKPGVIAPVVDLKRCEGKGDCVAVCPENVFEIRHIDKADYLGLNVMHRLKQRVHGMKVAYTPNAHACQSCGLCVTACPERAITLVRRA